MLDDIRLCNQRVPEEDSYGGGRECKGKAILWVNNQQRYCEQCAITEFRRLRQIEKKIRNFSKEVGPLIREL